MIRMNILSLSSSHSISNQLHFHPLSNNKHQKPLSMHFSVSCRATTHADANNFYNMLSLCPKSATMDDIKRSYRSMALRYHPDVCHDVSKKEESTKMFVKLNAAYNTLSNPRLRAEYDSELLLGLRSQTSVGDEYESWRCRWQQQVIQLKRRPQKKGSWGTKIRAQNMNIKW
ncbi:PREDICTED: DPH4 homolog [Lupinus angustifolius]|uniref:DPH4 homolog n=1 Tax=Lupinus angustifolius TaxID=3871 RepID=UPI00092F5AC8|nr:PREDICTED: DPH4 homolog [Lupinus angustifolius]